MLLLIDGSNLAHRALHASYRDLGHYSHEDGAVYFLKRLASFVRREELMAGVILAWDLGLPLHRRELYSEYKPDSEPLGTFDPRLRSKINLDSELSPHRSSRGNDSFLQAYQKLVDMMHEVVGPACNCISIRLRDVEADDIIGFCTFWLPEVPKKIQSSDNDMYQLIDGNTSISSFTSSHDNGNLHDYEWAELKYGDLTHFHRRFLLEKAIIGDTSDNIPGIEFVGETTAKKYSDSIMVDMISGLSLEDALQKLERPPRASNKGFENLKAGGAVIQRNMDVMDLHLPIHLKLDIYYSIHKAFSSALNLPKRDYYDSMDLLEEYQDMPFNNCFSHIDKIFESNCNFDMIEVLQELRDVE